MTKLFTMLQLADSAFPTGGFAHSSGLEAAIQAGLVAGEDALHAFCTESIAQLGASALPFVGAAWGDPSSLARLDALAGAMLWNHVAARASLAQGRALLDVAARAFDRAMLTDARRALSAGEIAGHFAPAFGVVARALDLAREDALAAFVHVNARGLLSAAVRLGMIGPTHAQSLQHALAPEMERAIADARTRSIEDAAQTSPLLEIFQGTHDRLYSRLFSS